MHAPKDDEDGDEGRKGEIHHAAFCVAGERAENRRVMGPHFLALCSELAYSKPRIHGFPDHMTTLSIVTKVFQNDRN